MPAGDYEVRLVLDLTPLFGRLEAARTLHIAPAPPEALDRRLADLVGEDVAARRAAAAEMSHFGRERKRVGEALVKCLKDPDGIVRRIALAALQGFAEYAAGAADTVLAIVESGEGRAPGERTNAALLASRTAPLSDRALAALTKALSEASEAEKPTLESALEFYRGRASPAK